MILWPCRKSCWKGRDGTYLPVVLACRVAQAVNVLRGAYLLLLPSSSQGRASGRGCEVHVSCIMSQRLSQQATGVDAAHTGGVGLTTAL
jgi:hypothetical protein